MRSRTAQKLIAEYLGKVTGFAHLKMADPHDAEDLAQDIMLQLIASLNRGAEVKNLDAYVWKVSCNVLNRSLRRKLHVTYVGLTGLEQIEDNTLGLLLSQEEEALVRREVALLSSVYRDAVVRFYYEGQSVRKIAQARGISEGTVKWWLFEARKELRKGVEMMRPNGERSLRPGHLGLAINGSAGRNGEPFRLVNGNLLAQNILLAAYEKPMDEAALSQELGVARPYVEGEVDLLVAAELLTKVGGDTFQTDFVISRAEMRMEAAEIVERVYQEIKGELDAFIDDQILLLMQPQSNEANFSAERIRWVAVLIVVKMLSQTTYRKIMDPVPTPERPECGRWIALGFAHGEDPQPNNAMRYGHNGPMSGYFGDGGRYGVGLLLHQFSGLNLDETGQQLFNTGGATVSMCMDLAKGQLNEEALGEVEKQVLAEAIRWRLIVRKNGVLKPNYLFVPKVCMSAIEESCAQFGERHLGQLREMIEGVSAVVRKHSPEHVGWQVATYSNTFYCQLMPMLLDDYYIEGRLSQPREEDKHLLSFYLSG